MKIFRTLSSKGFTLIELLVSISVFAILVGIITLNLNTAKHNVDLQTTVETLLTDISQQQIKAMVGDTEGRTSPDNYGINFDANKYTLFHGAYSDTESSNFSVNLADVFQMSTTLPSSVLVFAKGSGEIVGFDSDSNSITVIDTANNQQKTILLNKYGVVTAVN